MIFLMIGRVLLNFSTSGIFSVFAIVDFEVNKDSFVNFQYLVKLIS